MPLSFGFLVLSGCVRVPSELECRLDADDHGLIQDARERFSSAEDYVIQDAIDVQQSLAREPTLGGLQGAILRHFAGTRAYGFALHVRRLREEAARLEALRLAAENDGDTLVGTDQAWKCKALADGAAALSLDESQPDFLAALNDLKTHFASSRDTYEKAPNPP